MNRNGYDFVVLERTHVINSLYKNIPDKSRILTSKRVNNVVQHAESVEVTCDDGSVYEGDILLGCDGVNSTVRDFMWEQANADKPGFITAKEKTCQFSNALD